MSEPFWKGIFTEGEFSWKFQMRRGDAPSFFANTERHEELIAEKRHWLKKMPEQCVCLSSAGELLVDSLWERARDWGIAPPDAAGSLGDLSLLWEPDVLLLETEKMTVAGGSICAPSSWILQRATGLSLEEVHGFVPRLNPSIGNKIDRFLKQLEPGSGKDFLRENWSLTRSAELNYHPNLERPPLDETVTLEELYLRLEHQIFTGLPGGVLMGIRIANCPLQEVASDPVTWQALKEKIATMPENVAEYKSMRTAQEAIVREMGRIG